MDIPLLRNRRGTKSTQNFHEDSQGIHVGGGNLKVNAKGWFGKGNYIKSKGHFGYPAAKFEGMYPSSCSSLHIPIQWHKAAF